MKKGRVQGFEDSRVRVTTKEIFEKLHDDSETPFLCIECGRTECEIADWNECNQGLIFCSEFREVHS